MQQRRTSTRLSMNLPVEIRWKSRAGTPKLAVGTIGNISGSGLFIEFPVRLRPRTSVAIKIRLPREGNQAPLELMCEGRIVRSNPMGKAQGVGAVIDEYELRPASSGKSQRKRASARA